MRFWAPIGSNGVSARDGDDDGAKVAGLIRKRPSVAAASTPAAISVPASKRRRGAVDATTAPGAPDATDGAIRSDADADMGAGECRGNGAAAGRPLSDSRPPQPIQ